MSEYKLWREEALDRHVLAMLPEFCGQCLEVGDCTDACEPIALERCYRVKRFKGYLEKEGVRE